MPAKLLSASVIFDGAMAGAGGDGVSVASNQRGRDGRVEGLVSASFAGG